MHEVQPSSRTQESCITACTTCEIVHMYHMWNFKTPLFLSAGPMVQAVQMYNQQHTIILTKILPMSLRNNMQSLGGNISNLPKFRIVGWKIKCPSLESHLFRPTVPGQGVCIYFCLSPLFFQHKQAQHLSCWLDTLWKLSFKTTATMGTTKLYLFAACIQSQPILTKVLSFLLQLAAWDPLHMAWRRRWHSHWVANCLRSLLS